MRTAFCASGLPNDSAGAPGGDEASGRAGAEARGMSELPVQRWITALAPGRSFVDIGGIGEGSVNERVSQAVALGAARRAMADIEPAESSRWRAFHEKMAGLGVPRDGYESHAEVDVTRPDLPERLPAFDVVHCTGILYHCPDPVAALHNIRRITGRWLIVNTVICPERLENDAGALALPEGGALFLPGLSEHARAVLRRHYQVRLGWSPDYGLDYVAPRPRTPGVAVPHLAPDGRLSCWHWWWLFSAPAFRALLRLMEFEIRDEWTWEDHAHFALCERAP